MDRHLLRFRKDAKYCFIDLETFNLCLSFVRNRPWQVGVLEVTGEEITASHDILVKWKTHLKIGREAAMITKYSQERMDAYGISHEEAFERFHPALVRCDHIIMHNGLRFDLHLIKEYYNMMGVDWRFILPKILDTKAIAQGIKMNLPFNPKTDNFHEYQYRMANSFVRGIKTSLSTLGKEYGIQHDYDRLHDAIVDLELNLKVWNKLKHQIEI